MGVQINGDTGNVSATKGTYSSNLTVGGVLTFEDVTNVDSIGIVTARTDINLGDSIIHIDDTNTKIRFPEADTISAETGGSERLRITSGGRVNIGDRTTSPDELVHIHTASGEANVHVEAATNANLNLRSHSGDSTIQFSDASASNVGNINYDHGTDSLSFRTNSGKRLTITSDGDIEVQGESSSSPYPVRKLKWSNDSTTTNGFYIAQHSDRDARIWHEQGLALSFGTNNTERFRITSDGKVGINDNDPDLTLHVKDGDLSGRSAANSNCDVLIEGTDNTGIQFYSGTQTQLRFGDAASTAAGAIIYQHTDNQFKFNYNSSGFVTFNASGERVRITGDGRLFVGPSVNSNADTFKMTIKESSSENAAIMFLDTDNMRGGICGIAKGTDQILSGTTNVDFVVGSVYSDTHIIYGQVSNQVGLIGMTVRGDSGNVGISETSPTTKLHVKNDSACIIQGESTNNNTSTVLQLLGKNSSGTVRTAKIAYDNADEFRIVTPDAIPIRFFTQNSSRLIITSAGRIGINQDSPDAASLHIGNSVASTSSNIGLLVGTVSANRYLTINHFNNQQNFSSLKMRVNDNQLQAMLDLGNPFGGVGFGTKIKISGYNDSEVGAIEFVNTASNSSSAVDMVLRTGGTSEKLRIKSTGDAYFSDGIFFSGTQGSGNNNDYGRLNVLGSGVYGVTIQHGTSVVMTNEQGQTTQAMVLGDTSSGTDGSALWGVSINNSTNDPTTGSESGWSEKARVEGNGDFVISGGLSASGSDDRLKKNKVGITSALSKVCAMEGFTFEWNDVADKIGMSDGDRHFGLSAQTVEPLAPEVVVVNDILINPDDGTNDYKTIKYERLVPMLVEAIKELKTDNDALRSRISALEGS